MRTRRAAGQRMRRYGVLLACSSLAVPPLCLSGLCAWSGLGHLFWGFLGTTGLIAAPAAFLCSSRRGARYTSLGLGIVSMAIVVWLTVPAGDSHRHSGSTRSCFLSAEDASSPWFSRIPEIELVLLGGLMGLSAEERAETEDLGLFREVYARPDLLPDPPVVPDSWLFDRGHYWLAMPPSERPVALLVFLHGSGGNFQAYPRVLARVALECNVAVAMPTLGWGRWWEIAGQERALRVLDDILRHHSTIDPDRIFIGGISAGSIGAFHTCASHPTRFCGALGISGVPSTSIAMQPFEGKSILIVHGVDDARIPVRDARQFSNQLRNSGAEVDTIEIPDAGHFVLLTHQERVLAGVFALLREP